MTQKKRQLIILGVGRHSRSIADLVEVMNSRQPQNDKIMGFLDDRKELWHTEIAGYPILGPLEEARNFSNSFFVNGIYSASNLKKLPEIIKKTGVPPERWPTIIHPLAYVSPRAQLGHGVFVYPGVYIYNETIIEDYVLFKPRSTAGVEVKIGWGSVIGTNAITAGRVTIGKSCYLGQSCSIREFLRIGDGAIIGMGSVVINDVPAGSMVAGNPARPLKINH